MPYPPVFQALRPTKSVMTRHHQNRLSTNLMLIKMIFEVDPLVCPECGGEMKNICIIDRHQKDVLKHNFNNENKFSVSLIVHDILECCGLWHESSPPKLVPLVFQLKNAEREF